MLQKVSGYSEQLLSDYLKTLKNEQNDRVLFGYILLNLK